MGGTVAEVTKKQKENLDTKEEKGQKKIPEKQREEEEIQTTQDNRQQLEALKKELEAKKYIERKEEEHTKLTVKILPKNGIAKISDLTSGKEIAGQKVVDTVIGGIMDYTIPEIGDGITQGIHYISDKTHPERKINQVKEIEDNTTHERGGEGILSLDKAVRMYPTVIEQDGKSGKGDVVILARNLANIETTGEKNKIEIKEIKDCIFSMEETFSIDDIPDEIEIKINEKKAVMEKVKIIEGRLQAERIVYSGVDGFYLTGITFNSGNIYYENRYVDVKVPEDINLGKIFSYNEETGEIHINDIGYEHEFLKDLKFGPPALAGPPPFDFANVKLEFAPILKAGFKLSAESSDIKGLMKGITEEESSAIDIGFQGVLEGSVGLGATAHLNLQLPGATIIKCVPGFYAGFWGQLYAALKGVITMKTAIQKQKGRIILAKDMEFDADSSIQLRGTAGFHTGASLLVWKGDFIKITFGEWIMAQMNAGGKFARLKNGEWELRDSFFDFSGFGKRLYENNSAENFYGLSMAGEKIQNKMDTSYDNVIAFAKDAHTIHILKGDTTSTEFIDKVEELHQQFFKVNQEAKENLHLLTAIKDAMQGDKKIQKQIERLQNLKLKHQERIQQLEKWDEEKADDIHQKYEEKYGGAGYKQFRESRLEEKAKQEIMTLKELINYEMRRIEEISSSEKVLKHEERILRLREKKSEKVSQVQEEKESGIEEKEEDKKKQMLDFYKEELGGGKGFVKELQEHVTPAMLLKYEKKRKIELIKEKEEIRRKLQEFINKQMEQDESFDINKPNQDVYEYYKKIGGTAGKIVLAKSLEIDKVATGEDIIEYERKKVETSERYQKHLERILWLQNMIKIRNAKKITDEEVVEKYKSEKNAKGFENKIMSMALTEDIIQYETNKRTELREKNDTRADLLKNAEKEGKSLEEIKKIYSDNGGNISHAEQYAKKQRGNRIVVDNIIVYENNRLKYYKEKRDEKNIKKHENRITLLGHWKDSCTEEEIIKRYQKEFNAEKFIKESYQKQQNEPITVKEMIAYERSKADKKSEIHTKRLQQLNQLKEQDFSEFQIKQRYKRFDGGVGFEHAIKEEFKSGKRSIKIENLIAYERSRLNELTNGHLERLERLEYVKKAGATKEQIKAEYAILGGGTGFKRNLQENKDIFLTPKKLLEFEEKKIQEKGEKHEKRIKMLEELQDIDSKEVKKKYDIERLREKTKGKSIESKLTEDVSSGMLAIGLRKKGRFEKDLEKNIQEYIEPEQIMQYEQKRSQQLQQKHKDRLEMLKQMAEQKTTEEEIRNEYKKKGGNGFEKAHKNEINERKKQKIESDEMKGVTDIKAYETSRETYYNDRMEQLKKPILRIEEGIQKIERYEKDCEKVLKEIELIKQEPEGNIDSFILVLEEHGKVKIVQEEKKKVEKEYGAEATQNAKDALEQIQEKESESEEE